MPKFRKKPVVIEAVQYSRLEHGENPYAIEGGVPSWLSEAYDAETVYPEFCPGPGSDPTVTGWWTLKIKTLEGEMTVHPGSWIIRGFRGELYPHDPYIFADVYEPVDQADVGNDWEPHD